MKVFKSIQELGINNFGELQELSEILLREITTAIEKETECLEIKWKDKVFPISLDSMDFLFGFTYGTLVAFKEAENIKSGTD